MKEVWAVCRLRADRDKEVFSLDGIYDTREAALAASVDDETSVVRFDVNKDYRDIEEFEILRP